MYNINIIKNKNIILALFSIAFYTIFERKPNITSLQELETYGFSLIYINDLLYNALLIYKKQAYLDFTKQDLFEYFSSLDFLMDVDEFNDDLLISDILDNNEDVTGYIVHSLYLIKSEVLDEMHLVHYSENKEITDNLQSGKFKFVLHEHNANRAGKHYDLRIELKKDYVISIAFRYNPFMQDKALGFIQPIHTSRWLDFEGEIEEGYGAGTLKIVAKGTCKLFKSENSIVGYFIDAKNGKKYQLAFIHDKKINANLNALFIVHTQKEYKDLASINEIKDYFKPIEETKEKISI